MAYDEDLADRVRAALGEQPALTEKRMFGGLGFMVEGHMAVAASGQGGLMVRVDPAASEELVDHVLVERVVMRGRAMDGWLRVATQAVGDEEALRSWVARGVAAARALG
jgi:TfoX/Sxy family transcriptional regulator of competence genes